MRTSKKILLSCAVVILTTVLVSWNRNNSTKELNTSRWSYLPEKDFLEFTNAEMNGLIAADDEFQFSPGSGQVAPTAEDVLVQKIPGDNSHLLIMAFYSKENFSGPFVSIENGGHLVFRDDGRGYDKKAGDGLYTAKVAVDVNEFRRTALNMTAQMKKIDYKPIRFEHRAMIADPDADESFDIQKWESGDAVSISGLTNALSDLDISDNAASSGVSAATTTIPGFIDSIRTHCVFITSLAVVEDPTRTWNSCAQKGNVDGPWTFKTIMKQLASKDPSHIATDAQVSDFVKNWLGKWATTQIVNGDTVAARPLVNSKILTPWLTKSKNAGAPTGQLDMRFAPFKLLAMVNRFDLREGGVHGIPGSGVGEGRFVFGLISSACDGPLKMGVILEFGVNKPNTCDARKAWAQQWIALKNFTVGSSQYNQALQAITDQYSKCGTNPARPNQSSLDQLRTNEQALSSANPGVWEMKEFVVDPGGTGFLKQNTVAQNPSDKYNAQVINANVERMVKYVNSNTLAIKRDSFSVPLTWENLPFLGGAAKLITVTTGQVASPTGQPPKPYHWAGTDSTNRSTFIRNDAARFNFSLNTCWGCHGGETQTGFTHVDPVFFGTKATLSGFLTGKAGTGGAIDFDKDSTNENMTIKDPTGSATQRTFNDILRRARDLNRASKADCGTALSISSDLLFKPLNSVD